MKAIIGVLVFIVFMFGLWVKECCAEPPCYYQHLTNYEVNAPYQMHDFFWDFRFDSYDTLYGPVRSNDYLSLKWRPVFYGSFITSKDRFFSFDANPTFAVEPVFNAPIYPFPREMPHLAEWRRTRSLSGHDDLFVTRIKLLGEWWEAHQYRKGLEYRDSLISSGILWPLDYPYVIFVDGDVEVEGVMQGRLTIYSSGDIFLTDNIRYSGSDTARGRFGSTYEEQRDMQHMLGLVSDKNIIIQNNNSNGRANGAAQGPNRFDRHSIVINAALLALNESFTFQQQNDVWDFYQGPTPDERGVIYLTGSVAQWRRGYTHRSNHGTGGGNGTGYGDKYIYDYRFANDGPPGLSPSDYPLVEGVYQRLDFGFSQKYTISITDVHTLIIPQNLEIELTGENALIVRDTLRIIGTEGNPVIIHSPYEMIEAGLRTLENCVIEISYVQFSGINIDFIGESILLKNCTFTNEICLNGLVTIDSCTFSAPVSVENWDRTTISRSVFNDGISLYAGNGNIDFVNNTVTGSRGEGIELRRFGTARLVNNIIAFNRDGIINRHWLKPQIEYCNVYGNTHDDFDASEPGEGCISDDPLFINAQQIDYRLWSQSPCLDAGDPASPHDPDGSVADMGVYFIDKNVAVEEEAIVPQEFTFSAYPNPFNSRTTLNYTLPEQSLVNIAIYDLSGRKVAVLADDLLPAGSYSAIWNGISMPSGIYMAVIQTGNYTETKKLVLMG